MSWLSENIGTILVLLVLAALVTMIVRHMRKDKSQGKSSCGGNCAHCALHGSCHSADGEKAGRK